MTVPDRELLVVYKPDGLPRTCTDDEVQRAMIAWASLLSWLRGADPDDLPESELIGHVAREAALHMPRSADYDLNQWAQQGRSLDHLPSHERPRCGALTTLVPAVFTSIELQRRNNKRCCWLNRVAIELLYGDAASFRHTRETWVPRLLDGPVAIERWTGQRLELALAAKFLLRKILSAAPITNLVHIEVTTSTHATNVEKAITVATAVDQQATS